IRDLIVTGVQTCALPIFLRGRRSHLAHPGGGGSARLPVRPSVEPRGRASPRDARERLVRGPRRARGRMTAPVTFYFVRHGESEEIGRASCRERVEMGVVA